MSERRCETCRWWRYLVRDNRIVGWCVAPANIEAAGYATMAMHKDDWCGEHQPRETGDG